MSEEHERCRVLLADDYPRMHSALTRLLMPWCDVVGGVQDVAELLEAVGRLRPDIVVLDVRMPGANGVDACRHIKSAAPEVHVIVFTASDDARLRVSAFAAGASAFVLKSRVAQDLVAAIRQTSWLLRPAAIHRGGVDIRRNPDARGNLGAGTPGG